MRLEELCEGMMKRSHPLVSGEQEYQTKEVKTPKKKTINRDAFDKRMHTIANKCNVAPSKVYATWREIERSVDPRIANKWAVVTRKVYDALGY